MQRTKQGEFSWVDLVAADLDGQTRFYESLFGWTHDDVQTDVGPVYRTFRKDGRIVAAASQRSPEMAAQGVPTMWNTYIAAEDVDAVAAKAVELGGAVTMPAMDVMDQGRMVGIADPTGAPVFFWQANAHKGAEVFMEPGTFTWSDLTSRNPEKAVAFFSDLLGWKVDMLSGAQMPYWMITVAGRPEGGIMPMPPDMPAEVPSNWLVYFAVDDVRGFIECAVAAGGKADFAPIEAGGMTFGVFSDPAGAVFAVMEPMKQG